MITRNTKPQVSHMKMALPNKADQNNNISKQKDAMFRAKYNSFLWRKKHPRAKSLKSAI